MSTELVNGIYLIKNTGSGKYLNVWGMLIKWATVEMSINTIFRLN